MSETLLAALLLAQLFGAPSEAIAPVQVGGVATYCAPTPTRCQSWGGGALLGAVPSFRSGDHPYPATVCRGHRCVVVTVVSFCACGPRAGKDTVIDLSPAAFRRLAPLSRGVIEVTLTYGGIRLPATDTVGE